MECDRISLFISGNTRYNEYNFLRKYCHLPSVLRSHNLVTEDVKGGCASLMVGSGSGMKERKNERKKRKKKKERGMGRILCNSFRTISPWIGRCQYHFLKVEILSPGRSRKWPVRCPCQWKIKLGEQAAISCEWLKSSRHSQQKGAYDQRLAQATNLSGYHPPGPFFM